MLRNSALLLLLVPIAAAAHAGPPFPLVVDQRVDQYVLSIWTDPDVGTGTFFVILNPAMQGQSIPDDLQVQIGVAPVSGRLPEQLYSGVREELRGQLQFKALVQFDAQEIWNVHVRWQSSRDNGEFRTTVEATPPGYGRWEMLLYLLPFLAVGFLWIMAVVRRRSGRRAAGPVLQR